MPKSVITKWREVNRSVNQIIKSSNSESEQNILNSEHIVALKQKNLKFIFFILRKSQKNN